MPATPQDKDIETALKAIPVDDSVRGAAWDAFWGATDPGDFERRFANIPLPEAEKPKLRQLRFGIPVPQAIGPTQPSEKSVGGFAGNVIESSAGLFEPFLHPLRTASGVDQLMRGIVQSATGPLDESESARESIALAQSVWGALKDRYGTWEGFKEAVYKDPVGILADASAVLSGGAGLVRTVGRAGRLAGVPGVATRVSGVASGLERASEWTNPLGLVAKIAPPVERPLRWATKKAGYGASELLGLTTGERGEAIRTAAERMGPTVKAAIRGQTTELDILSDFRDSLQQVRVARGERYRAQLAAITSAGSPPLDLSPVRSNLDVILPKFGVREVPPPPTPARGETLAEFMTRDATYKATYRGLQPGELDFTRSTIHNPADQARVKGLVKDVRGWGARPDDLTPLGVDTLKRRIDDFYSDSSQARALVVDIGSGVRDVLKTVPGYPQMTRDYAIASGFITNVERELSLGARAGKGTAIRKLTYALRQNNEYRKVLTEALEGFTGADLKGQLAGYQLSKWAPRGLMGPLTGTAILAGVMKGMVNPAFLAELSLTSPRAVGELLIALSELKRIGKAAGPLLIDPRLYRGLGIPARGEGKQQRQADLPPIPTFPNRYPIPEVQ